VCQCNSRHFSDAGDEGVRDAAGKLTHHGQCDRWSAVNREKYCVGSAGMAGVDGAHPSGRLDVTHLVLYALILLRVCRS
jgi:hypothetical protein